MGGEVCYTRYKERGPWFEIQCVKNDIIAKELDGEDASFERGLLKAWGKHPGWEAAQEAPPHPHKKSKSGRFTCPLCGKSPADSFHHVIPRINGGTRTIRLCRDCHDKVEENWQEYAPLLTSLLDSRASRYKTKTIDGDIVSAKTIQRLLARGNG
jgi:5-methylcytosine-specific restriction endonuclease McrA